MHPPVLSRREAAVWTASFVVVAVILAVTKFTSTDPDSMLYSGLSARLAQEPIELWIAPEWWGLWPRLGFTGLYRDHPIGGFVLPAALARLGVPGEQAAYVVGVGAGVIALVLIGNLVARLTSHRDARAVLVLLQIMPVAFVFRIRANQEYAMLICLIVTILGIDRVRRSWWGLVGIASGLSAALVIKGAFVTLTMAGAGVWALANPTRTPGSILRPIAAGVMSLGVLAGVAFAYDAWYYYGTTEPFWSQYWGIQLSHVEVSTPLSGAATFLQHAGFYLVRYLWHPAPWSLALLAAAWRLRGRWEDTPEPAKYGLIFAVGYAAVLLLMLSPSSRVAERYVFSGTYAIATAGIVVMCRTWTRVGDAMARLDARVPALPAVVWLTLMLLRLGLGPLFPKIYL